MTTPGARLGYRDVLQLPHAPRLLLAALIGRLSFATVSLAMLLAVQRSTRSYAAAGAAVGAFGLANVLVAPARARLVDRAGQPVALPWLAAGYAALLCLLAGLTVSTTTASWLLVTTAGAAGLFPPPLGAAMRVLWGSLVEGPAMLARAYSLDAVAEELLFVTGPLLVGLTAAVAPPALGLIAAAGLALAGSLAMTRSPVSIGPRPLPDKVARRRDRQPGFRPLLVALLGVGLVLGTVEIAAPAFAQQHGNAASIGLLLAALSLGSAVGGLLYGQKLWRQPPVVRLLALGAALSLTSATLAVAQHVLVLGVLLTALGLFLAPALVTGYLLADELSPASARTEASSWINTASNAGAAIGAASAGVLVDHVNTTAAFTAGAAAACLCVLLASCRAHTIGRSRPTDPERP